MRFLSQSLVSDQTLPPGGGASPASSPQSDVRNGDESLLADVSVLNASNHVGTSDSNSLVKQTSSSCTGRHAAPPGWWREDIGFLCPLHRLRLTEGRDGQMGVTVEMMETT